MDIEKLIRAMVKEGVSDIHFKVGSPPKVRYNGELLPVKHDVISFQFMEEFVHHILTDRQKDVFDEKHEIDFSYAIPGFARFRVNAFRQRGSCAMVFRIISVNVPTLESLSLPNVLKKIALTERGMVIVTGVTGSGKSTTIAAMIEEINTNCKNHIITIEDPVEYLYRDKLSSINQRELGADTFSFIDALRAALRQDPDVILVGEMRDMETMNVAIKAAETGHLVFSTLHTVDTSRTINRIIDSFPPEQQPQLRLQLSENLQAIISQRLLPRKDGMGRVAAIEIMINTSTIQNYIIEPEKTHKIKEAIELGRSQYGSQSFDQHIMELYKTGMITFDIAVANATNQADFKRSLSFE